MTQIYEPKHAALGSDLRVADHLELHLHVARRRGHRERVHLDQVLGVARAGPAAVVREAGGGAAVHAAEGHFVPVIGALDRRGGSV